jgi:hypothetical protein
MARQQAARPTPIRNTGPAAHLDPLGVRQVTHATGVGDGDGAVRAQQRHELVLDAEAAGWEKIPVEYRSGGTAARRAIAQQPTIGAPATCRRSAPQCPPPCTTACPPVCTPRRRGHVHAPHALHVHAVHEELARLHGPQALSGGRVDVSIGSALDIFGGSLPYADVVAWSARQ